MSVKIKWMGKEVSREYAFKWIFDESYLDYWTEKLVDAYKKSNGRVKNFRLVGSVELSIEE